MNIFTPNKLDVTLNSKEEKAIKDCMLVLTSIQDEMAKFQCSILTNTYGQTVTYGDIDDILADFETLLRVVEMYGE